MTYVIECANDFVLTPRLLTAADGAVVTFRTREDAAAKKSQLDAQRSMFSSLSYRVVEGGRIDCDCGGVQCPTCDGESR